MGQRRLLDLATRGEVLDTCLYTTPGRYGAAGAATTWLVGSPGDVATALEGYRKLGITHFILSDTPYQQEISRIGDQVLPLLRAGSRPREGAYGHRDSRRSGTPGKGSGTAASPRKADTRSGDGGDTVAASRSPIVRTS